jgi:geranylgeranyl diphosphate synthase, type II
VQPDPHRLPAYLADARGRTLDELRRIVPDDTERTGGLYALMLDYPMREAKGLRPALAMATCRALGGRLDQVLPTAAVLELFHNAFLVHDDIEDGSELRRGAPTLHREHGVPIAINTGDGMLALALQPLLQNMAGIGLGRALRVLEVVARMARESAEGQALELAWIRDARWDLSRRDYLRMVWKKTAWYSFIAPVTVGALCAGADATQVRRLQHAAGLLGLAFQIQDDLLNLQDDTGGYGKEAAGDLWEGKRTLILLHALAGATPAEREEATRRLDRPRPGQVPVGVATRLEALVAAGELTPRGRDQLRAELGGGDGAEKRPEDVDWLLRLIARTGAMQAARADAVVRAEKAGRLLRGCSAWLPDSVHRAVIEDLVAYVTARAR